MIEGKRPSVNSNYPLGSKVIDYLTEFFLISKVSTINISLF